MIQAPLNREIRYSDAAHNMMIGENENYEPSLMQCQVPRLLSFNV